MGNESRNGNLEQRKCVLDRDIEFEQYPISTLFDFLSYQQIKAKATQTFPFTVNLASIRLLETDFQFIHSKAFQFKYKLNFF